MAIAAVPGYLKDKAFKEASPGMRFGMYLPIWMNRADQESVVKNRAGKKSREAQEIKEYLHANGMDSTIAWLNQRRSNRLNELWEKNDDESKQIWDRVCSLGRLDREVMTALLARQNALTDGLASENSYILAAQSTAPFTTGLGNEHPLENGFSFLWPYGLPYLSGSGVKGVIRQAARELAGGIWGDNGGWSQEKIYSITIDKTSVALSTLDVLFGLESDNGEKEHVKGVLSFWDVIPQIKGNQLLVEVMTPHQKHYYQEGQAPHDSGQPIPITFLTIPPESGFVFTVICDRVRLSRIAPELARDEKWKALLESAFHHAFDWLGFGAKTAIGYGAMEVDLEAIEAIKQEAEQRHLQEQEQIRQASMSQVERDMEEIERQGADNPAIALLQALESGRWNDPDDNHKVAKRIQSLWDAEGKWIPDFTGKNKQKVKQMHRCQKVLQWLKP